MKFMKGKISRYGAIFTTVNILGFRETRGQALYTLPIFSYKHTSWHIKLLIIKIFMFDKETLLN